MTTGAFTLSFYGGLGEIGKNCLAVAGPEGAFLVDCGLAFPRSSLPVAEQVLPDIEKISRIPGLAALILTHGHEDHLGAVPYLLKKINLPIYGPPFALEVLKDKLEEHGITKARLFAVHPRQQLEMPGCSVEFIRVTHSIPDALGLVIRTPHGNIFHAGDFRIDNDPLKGEPFQMEAFERLGDEGVCVYLGDSTNATAPGRSRSEKHDVAPNMERLLKQHPGRVLITMFASNAHRMELLAQLGKKSGRQVCLLGRSMESYTRAAVKCKETSFRLESCITPAAAEELPDGNVLILATGSQGEPRSALARLAAGTHPNIRIRESDLVIFSSRKIPGNELDIATMCNDLARQGASVITPDQLCVHASGHACREELLEVLAALRPKYFVPVHGEYSFMTSHARTARDELGVDSVIVEAVECGAVLELEDGELRPGGFIATESYYVQGSLCGTEEQMRIKERKKLFFNGAIFVYLRVGSRGRSIDDLRIECLGIPDIDGTLIERLEATVKKLVSAKKDSRNLASMEESIIRSMKQKIRAETDMKPLVTAVCVFD